MKKVIMLVAVFGFLTTFTRALWSPVQVVADGVGSTASKSVEWLNGGK